MKIRLGRKQDRNLYIQLGDEPSDEDEYLGVIFDPTRAFYIVQILNGESPPFDRGERG
jgi:hypothetical protein